MMIKHVSRQYETKFIKYLGTLLCVWVYAQIILPIQKERNLEYIALADNGIRKTPHLIAALAFM